MPVINGPASATSSATANALIQRDANSRASVADPAASTDIATKNYVDNHLPSIDRVYFTRTCAATASGAYIDTTVPPSSTWHTRSNGTNSSNSAQTNTKVTVLQNCLVHVYWSISYGSPAGGGNVANRILIDSIHGDTGSIFDNETSSQGGGVFTGSLSASLAMLNGESFEISSRNISFTSGTITPTIYCHLTFIPANITSTP